MKIAFDESGNTGQNLLDKDQPYFALASVRLSQTEVDELVGIFNSSAKELHFKRLRKSQQSKEELIKFLNHDLINWNKVKYQITNKEFALIGHIVDRFIEPVMYRNGKNIYKDRSNIILTNLLHIFGRNAWDKKLFDRFLLTFQNFIRNANKDTIIEFYRSTEELIASINRAEYTKILEWIIDSKEISESIINGVKGYIIDLTYPTFNLLSDSWYDQLNSTFQVIHDNSKAIEFYKDLLYFLSNPKKMDEMEVGYGNRKMTYPLKFTNIELVDSCDFYEVQIADLIASSLCFGLTNQSKIQTDEFVKEIWDSKLFNIYHHDLRPLDEDTLLQYIKDGDQEGVDSLDYLAEMQLRNEKGSTA